MWIEKIRRGVLEVQTEKGLRYLRPSLSERIRLLWTFRNFQLLPQQVLNQREVALVAAMLERGKFQRTAECRIGIVEWAPEPPPPDPDSSARLITPETSTLVNSTAMSGRANRRARRRRGRRGQQTGGALALSPACTARPQ